MKQSTLLNIANGSVAASVLLMVLGRITVEGSMIGYAIAAGFYIAAAITKDKS